MRKKKKTKLVKYITKKLEKVRVIESAFWYLFLNLNSDFPHKKNVFKGDIPAESLEKILQKILSFHTHSKVILQRCLKSKKSSLIRASRILESFEES